MNSEIDVNLSLIHISAEVDLSNILDTNFVSEKVEYNKKSLYDFKLESTLDERIPVSYTHLDVYKRQ